jgi:hypothetical protein
MNFVNKLKDAFNNYIKRCKLIFNEKHSELPKVIPLKKGVEIDSKSILNQTIRECERSNEFDAIINLVKNHKLFKRKYDKVIKISIDSFFKNTGTYYYLWIGEKININPLVDVFIESSEKTSFNRTNLFVFDGFVLFDNDIDRKLLTDISLPFGTLQVLQKNEIGELFKIPYFEYHYHLNKEKIDNLINCYCLKITEEENYRKPAGIIADNNLFPIDFFELKKRDDDIHYIGPLFLYLGEDANLAEEIRIRDCIFDSQPISICIRNDYLPPKLSVHDGEVDFSPRRYVNYIGKEGIILIHIYKIWNEVNQLDKKGYLQFSTESYVRSIMNLHKHDDSVMENFVSFITVIDSILTRDGRGDLTYKIASRGSGILSPDPRERVVLMSKLKEMYKIRSTIVHEGHSKKKYLDGLLAILPDLTRHIFIKFIAIAYLLKNNMFDSDIMKFITEPKNYNKSISEILDFSVMEPEMVNIIEKRLSDMHIELSKLDIRSLVQ